MRLCLDASAIIYLVEGIPSRRHQVAVAIAGAKAGGAGLIFTSALSCIECRVLPMRQHNGVLLTRYDELLLHGLIAVDLISMDVLDCAAHLRADHNFKVPGAIHLATAKVHKADVFLTGDQHLARCPGLTVEVIA